MLNEDILDTMLRMAMEATRNAYVEHTALAVGACALAEDGTLYTGCTIDNRDQRLYCNAEALALFKGIADGKREFDAVLVVADTEDPYIPSGASLQLLAEFDVQEIIMANMNGAKERTTLDKLLPYAAKMKKNHLFNVEEDV
ncbi:MAG: cytidine deaminase [Selenomonadaceae bacterium]|nr:cytidine deaminase [Selenomonadaceae bacterium]